jgi:microsomal dipeptidase-like Zn-dependent dipeptidase
MTAASRTGVHNGWGRWFRRRSGMRLALVLAMAAGSAGLGGTTDPAAAATVRGYADLHAHWFSNFVPGNFGHYRDYAGVYCAARGGTPAPPLADQAACALTGIGWPDLPEFPNFLAADRDQKAYWEWLRRAWYYGQRLAVVHAVYVDGACRNPIAGRQRFQYGDDCGVDKAIDSQIRQIVDFVQWVKDIDPGDPNDHWLEIAYTPDQARQIIADGRMAVILGVEVDDLFGCAKKACTTADVDAGLRHLWGLGVRHVFPIHGIDNGFGGSGFFHEGYGLSLWNYNQPPWFGLRQCPGNDVSFRFWGTLGFGGGVTGNGDDLAAVAALLKAYHPLNVFQPEYYWNNHCNPRGLTTAGEHLVREMMRYGMVLDIDHMSELSFDGVYAVATDSTFQSSIGRSGPYPLVSGHTSFRELLPDHSGAFSYLKHTERNGRVAGEFHKSIDQIQKIAATGGMIAPILTQRAVRSYGGSRSTTPANNCMDSSRTWTQVFQRAVDLMGGTHVGLATDVNGGAPFPAPRYGKDACGAHQADGAWVAAQRAAQLRTPKLVYGVDTLEGKVLDQSVTGNLAFDHNIDGVAHYGMVPDMIADMGRIGVSGADLDVLWSSAEDYIDTWAAMQASYTMDVEVSAPIYHGIASSAPAAFLGSRNCPAGGTLTDPARWWEFTISVTGSTGFPAGSAFTVLDKPLFEGCILDGTATTPIRVAIPIAPKAPLYLGAYDGDWSVRLEHPSVPAVFIDRPVRLEVPRPTVDIAHLADASVVAGACPAWAPEVEASDERSLANAAIYVSTPTHLAQDLEARVTAHTGDFVVSGYQWTAQDPYQPLGSGPQTVAEFCDCGQRLVEVIVDEAAGLEEARIGRVLAAERPEVRVDTTFYDRFGRLMLDPVTAPEAAATVVLQAHSATVAPGLRQCLWRELRWSDPAAADPLGSETAVPAGRLVPQGDGCTATLTLWDPAVDGGSAPWSRLVRGVVMMSDGSQCGPTVFSLASDQRADAGPADFVLDPVRPLKTTIPAGHDEVFTKVKLTVANRSPEGGMAPVRLFATSLDCPESVLVDTPLFDFGDAEYADTAWLAAGERARAELALRLVAEDFPTHGPGTATRCRIHLSAGPAGTDPATQTVDPVANNAVLLEIDVADNNDPDTNDGPDLSVEPAKAHRLAIKRGATRTDAVLKLKVRNRGTTLSTFTVEVATAGCPPGFTTEGVVEEAQLAPGARLKLAIPVAAAALDVTSPDKRSPHRCHVSVAAVDPDDIDPGNDFRTFAVDITDANDR